MEPAGAVPPDRDREKYLIQQQHLLVQQQQQQQQQQHLQQHQLQQQSHHPHHLPPHNPQHHPMHHSLPQQQQQQQQHTTKHPQQVHQQQHHYPHHSALILGGTSGVAVATGATSAALGVGGGVTTIAATAAAPTGQQPIERLSRPMAFDKMEMLVREMQDTESGVPVRSQKLFLTSIPSAFMGYDLIEWLMERLGIEESEALNMANQLCLHGYFFPVNDSKTLVVKDDSSLYRFQTPYYWPWQHKAPDNVEYAIYLAKRSLRNKQRHGLEDYESEALASLHKNLKGKWDFITMQAEEQVKLAKERKKGDKIVGDSQERAYWRVHRPPPGQFTPLEPCPVPSRDRQGKPRRRTVDDWQRDVNFLTASLGRTRMKMSQACECLVQYFETFTEYDPLLQPALPSNPWVSEDITFWQLNGAYVEQPTEKRVKRWSISIEELVTDPTGLQEFTTYLKKEYSHENIRFWLAVNDLRRSAHSQISRKVKEIYEEFLAPGAPCEINIDGKTMEKVQTGLKAPSRFTFDAAAEHIYALLLKKDCYPRFIRSENYKLLLASGIQPLHKKRFFGFGGVAKKKTSTSQAPNSTLLSQGTGGQSSVTQSNTLTRRRGSDRSLTGSAHELAVSGVKDGTNKVPHSHSQSNLSDIPYRGDMPSGGLGMTGTPPQQATTSSVGATTVVSTDILVSASATATTPTTVVTSKIHGGHVDTVKRTNKQIQEGPAKLLTENLEVTLETGACAVCPWDIAESVEASVSVSVCPWDEEVTTSPSIPQIQPPTTTVVTTSKPKIRNNSAVEPGSSSSEISEVSERMRRSCGLRQNTVDCDFHSSKRLIPSVTEHRRASVTTTAAPRLSDLQFVNRQQALFSGANSIVSGLISPATIQKNVNVPISSTIVETSHTMMTPASTSSPSSTTLLTTTTPLVKTKIISEPENKILATVTTPQTMSTTTTIVSSSSSPPTIQTSTNINNNNNNNDNNQVNDNINNKNEQFVVINNNNLLNNNINKTIINNNNIDNDNDKVIIINNEIKVLSNVLITDNNNISSGNSVINVQEEEQQSVLVIAQGLDTTTTAALCCSSATIQTSQSPTPTISIVCPMGEEVIVIDDQLEPFEQEDINVEQTDISNPEEISNEDEIVEESINEESISIHQQEDDSQEVDDEAIEQLAEIQEEVDYDNHHQQQQQPPPVEPIVIEINPSIEMSITQDNDKKFQEQQQQQQHCPMETVEEQPEIGELSPTTDEYQECSQFHHEQQDEFEYDIVTGGGNLAPGCVAPAPTPAPSIAPLAEVEADPPDDDQDMETDANETKCEASGGEGTGSMSGSEHKKKKKRREGESSKKTGDSPSTPAKDSELPSSGLKPPGSDSTHNAVCPWEDEDVSTAAEDQPFVKTYATLGYL